jgi:hypothetical protein
MTAARVCVVNDVVQVPTNELLDLIAEHRRASWIQVGAAGIWSHYIKTITDGFKDGAQMLPAFLKILLGLLAVGDIEQASGIPKKLALGGEARAACIDDPPVYTIGSPQPILEEEFFISLVCEKEIFTCFLPIFRMHGIEPSEAQPFVLVLASELVPPLREDRAETIGLGHPEHSWSGVGKATKPLFAFLEGLLGPLLLGNDSHLVGSEPQQQPIIFSWKAYALRTSD